MSYDVAILGAGLDGLAAAGLLAKRGLRVIVLERGTSIGGTFATEEIAPGFRCDAVEHDIGWLPQRLIDELAPEKHGATLVRSDATATAIGWSGATPLTLWSDVTRTAAELARIAPDDARQWPALAARIARLSSFLQSLYESPPPRPLADGAGDLFALLGTGRRARALGREGIYDLLRTLPMSVADFLGEHVRHDAVAGMLAATGVTGILQGARSGGTTFVLLHRHVGAPNGAVRSRLVAKGGMGALSGALAAAAQSFGATVRTNADVARIVLRDGAASGILLASGDTIDARAVLSTLDLRRTVHELLEPEQVEPELSLAVARIKHRGAVAKVNLALDALPESLAALGDERLRGAIVVAPSVRMVERAYDAAKHGSVSERPILEARIPTMHDASLAPAGKHTMSVLVQFAPYRLADGEWTDARRDALGACVLAQLEEAMPGLGARVLATRVMSPADLEARYGCAEGSLTHGELTLDQILFMRPIPECAAYATPIPGLYVGGLASHPGLAGAAGTIAAKVVEQGLKTKRGARTLARSGT